MIDDLTIDVSMVASMNRYIDLLMGSSMVTSSIIDP
jgi:hypothetical protein